MLWAGLLAPLVFGCDAIVLGPAPAKATRVLEARPLSRHVEFLAAGSMEGRCASTRANRAAGDYIASQMAQAGLRPGRPQGQWFHSFPLEGMMSPAAHCSLSLGKEEPLGCGIDYAPLASGCDGAFDAPLVFAGYGVHNRIRSYNDYENLNPRGNVVMVLQGEPHHPTGQSKWALPGKWTRLASIRYKLREAASRGASALLLVTPEALAVGADPLEMPVGAGKGPLPAARISRRVANRLLAPTGRTVDHLVQVIHASGAPASMAVGTRVRGTIALEPARGRNVVGVLAPDAADSGEWIVVGAHYDHLCPSGDKARDSGFGVRPGADDNASGVSVLLQLARAMAQTPGRTRTIAFVAFDGEEYGFQGSEAYVSLLAQRDRLQSLRAMVNLDQLGHIRKDRILVLGATGSGLPAQALAGARNRSDLNVQPLPVTSAHHWSDQAPFVREGVKTLFFYAGRTGNYHTRRDTPESLNYPGMAAAAKLIYDTLRALASAEG
jgi:hypothetical protein